MDKNNRTKRTRKFYEAVLQLKDMEQCCDFFEDLCTLKEIQVMEQRFEVAGMLKKDKVYTEIAEKTNASSATISRVKRMLDYGTGCLSEMIDMIQEQEEEKE